MNDTRHKDFIHVENLWDDDHANKLSPLERLVYRSNLLGQDWRITNTGGGNTSTKLQERDPISGESVEVLWVKGSGGDLRTAKNVNFASLYQQKVMDLQAVYAGFDLTGPKTPAEDAMVAMYQHCTFNLNTRAPSIDTPLHSFIPHSHVDHTHPVACIALATAADGPALTREIYGDEVIWTDWQRPGFELGLTLQQVCRDHPQAKGIMLGGHGLINWADNDKDCYLLSLDLIERAAAFIAARDQGNDTFGGLKHAALPDTRQREVLTEILPWLRGQLSTEKRLIATVELDPRVLSFINANDAPRLAELGTSCPDHFLRTKIKPLYVDWDPATSSIADLKEVIEKGLAQYQKDYEAYYTSCKRDGSPAIRGGNPTVHLIPGIGMVAWGKTKSESRVTAEFYKCAIEVMRGAEAVSSYTALPRQEAFDIEYWALEEAKLQRMPAEKELARQIAVVIGAGSGIGKVTARRLIKAGATVAAVDLRESAAKGTADEIMAEIGMGIGVAGSGLSGAGDIIGLGGDITNRSQIKESLQEVIFAYGGIDHVIISSGLYVSPDEDGRIPDARWDDTFRVNVTGPFIVAEEAHAIFKSQGLTGSLVIATSVNAVVPKKGSFAYDTSKTAANHLIRELAIAMAPLVRVNGVAPATVVKGSSMFPRDRVLDSLKKYSLPFDESEDTETLRNRLAAFYAQRTLIKEPIEPADQAEAIFLLVSQRLSKTTGQVITVDGGLESAFLR
ncbi:MAG: bifunctional rhamnulose-1-phosphate aldolase/short-chain dehydrogenase [Rhodothermales bacterium]